MLASALGGLLLFSILAFAATEQWALSTLQVGIFALGVWCAMRRPLTPHPVGLALAGIVALAGLQIAAGSTVYRFVTERALIAWAAYLALFLVALEALADSDVRRRFLQATLYAGAAIAAFSTVQYFTSGGAIYWLFQPRAGRPFGPFVNPDHYAAFVELILPLAIHEAQRNRRRLWLHLGLAGALYGSVIAGASRAGAALATLEIVALPLLAMRLRAGKVIAVTVAFAALATAVVGGDLLWKRVQDKDPLRYRREIFVSTLQMIRQHPWTGYGLGAYATVYPEFASFDIGQAVDHAHNDWTEWTAEGGVLMLLLMLAIAAAGFRPALRSGWGLGIYAVFLHSLVDFPLQIPAIGALLFTLMAAATHGGCGAANPGGEPALQPAS